MLRSLASLHLDHFGWLFVGENFVFELSPQVYHSMLSPELITPVLSWQLLRPILLFNFFLSLLFSELVLAYLVSFLLLLSILLGVIGRRYLQRRVDQQVVVGLFVSYFQVEILVDFVESLRVYSFCEVRMLLGPVLKNSSEAWTNAGGLLE